MSDPRRRRRNTTVSADASGGGDSEEWLCVLCEDEIEPGEPFNTMAIRTGASRRDFELAPIHRSCDTEVVAAATADIVLDAINDQQQPIKLKVDGVDEDDTRATLWELAKRWLTGEL